MRESRKRSTRSTIVLQAEDPRAKGQGQDHDHLPEV